MTAPAAWAPLYADWATNAKLRMVARRSGQPLVIVSAISAHLICPAWWSEWGVFKNDYQLFIAAALDLGEEVVIAICEAMQGLLLDGTRLKGWESRSLGRPREDLSAGSSAAVRPKAPKTDAQRAKEARERRKRVQSELPFTIATDCPEHQRTHSEHQKTDSDRHETDSGRHETDSDRHEIRHETDSENVTIVTPREAEIIPLDQHLRRDVTLSRPESESEQESEQEGSLRERDARARPPLSQRDNFSRQVRHGQRTPLAADWQPDQQDVDYAAARGYDDGWIWRESERFRDWHLKEGALVADAHAAWRCWIARAPDFAARSGGGAGLGGQLAQSGKSSVAATVDRLLTRYRMG